MKVTIGSTITVENPSQDVIRWCEQNLRIRNPEYAKKVQMHFWLGNTPQILNLYEKRGNALVLPFGVLREILPLIHGAEVNSSFSDSPMVCFNCDVPLYDYQEEAVSAVLEEHYGILQSPAGSGKGLPLDAKIYTPNGYKLNGDLSVGDEILNSYGGISKVTGIYDRGEQRCYKVTFTDNSTIVCDADHLWAVADRNDQWKNHPAPYKVKSTHEIVGIGLTTPNGNRRFRIPIASPVSFEKKTIPIDPWLLGFLLADGCFRDGITFSNAEDDLIQKVKMLVGGKISHLSSYDYSIRDNAEIANKIHELGLSHRRSWEKHIPKVYKYNSIEIRQSVLQGLIDGDGSTGKAGSVNITTTSLDLAKDILEVTQSLGGTGKISERQTYYSYRGEKKKGKKSYRVFLKVYGFLPFTSQKHNANYIPKTKYIEPYRIIKSIEPAESQQTRCITVDSKDNLYLTDGFIVTHNTQMGIALVAKLGKRTLWLTHTKDLLNQSMSRAKQYMNDSLIGTITEGKVSIGSGITFATIQTMCRLDLAQYKDLWDCIIVDEGHRVAGTPTAMTQFSKVLNSLAARHKIGLSATVHRSDGMIKATYALLGTIVYTVPDEAVGDRIMKVGIAPVFTGVKLSNECLNTDGTLNYSRLISYLCEDFQRNHLISSRIVAESEHPSLILSDRLEHLETLMSTLPRKMQEQAVMISGKMTSKKGKAEREQAIEDMRTGKKKYLFATYSLAKEGLDIPCLERLYMATPQKDYAIVTQSIGRIARTAEGKQNPVCFDFVDGIGYLFKSYKKRCSTYKKNGCYFVEEGGQDE